LPRSTSTRRPGRPRVGAGIGPLAGKILDERKKSSFKDWDDLVERVKGIGEANAAKLSAGGLTVGGAAYRGGAPAGKKDDKPATAATKDDKAAASAPSAAAAATATKVDEKAATKK
jgi:competence protein ComEA